MIFVHGSDWSARRLILRREMIRSERGYVYVCMYVCTAVVVADLKEDTVDHLSEFVLTAGKVTSVAHGYGHPPYFCGTGFACIVAFYLGFLVILHSRHQLVWYLLWSSRLREHLLISFSLLHLSPGFPFQRNLTWFLMAWG